MTEPKKMGARFPVWLEESLAIERALMSAAYGAMTASPEDKAKSEKRRKQVMAEKVAEAQRRHEEVKVRLDDTRLGVVLDLHGPKPGFFTVECHGCEFDGYEAEPPQFPCATWTLIEEMQ